MKVSVAYSSSMFVFVSIFALLLTSAYAAPMRPPSSALPDESVRRLSEAKPSISTSPAIAIAAEESEDEQSENSLVGRDGDDLPAAPWDAVNAAALRKLLLQLDAEDRLGLGRVGRSWPQVEPRGWSLRALDGRFARPWRADKRQVRFRQCYFNPISCFRK